MEAENYSKFDSLDIRIGIQEPGRHRLTAPVRTTLTALSLYVRQSMIIQGIWLSQNPAWTIIMKR